jgi:hypothetical protein
MLGGNSPVDCIGRGGAPVELKVLGVLRILGRATCFDGITELSGIPTSSMQALSHRFTAWFPKDIYPEFVYAPKTREDLARVETPYALVGLPGCIGSMGVVHIAWCMCPTYYDLERLGSDQLRTPLFSHDQPTYFSLIILYSYKNLFISP